MIKLEDISTQMFEKRLKNRLESEDNVEEVFTAISVLNNYFVEDYEYLKYFIELDNPDFNTKIFKQELEKVKKCIETLMSQGINPEIYSSNGYRLGIIDLRSLEITDKNTSGRNLILKSPTNIRYTNKDSFISSHSIEQLKFMLSHVHLNLSNVLLYGNHYLKRKDIPNLIKAINFYEEQVIRQAQEIKKDPSIYLPLNIFEYNKEIKREMVKLQIKEITEYLVDCGNEYIWGKLSDPEKLRLIKSVSSNSDNLMIMKNMIDIITNYTTESELENGIKTKTLKRFIVR